jgi:cell division protein FtsA
MSQLSYGLAPRMRPIDKKRTSVVAALDIGTSKIACLIGRLRPLGEDTTLRGRSHTVDLIGFGQTRARGIKAGAIADMNKTEEAIRLAVDAAERSAKVEIGSVVLSISGGRLGSESFAASARLLGPSVDDNDVSRVLDAASLHSVRDGRGVMHSLPVSFALDQVSGIREPRGMLGEVLSADLHVITADLPALKNLVLCVERCHLAVDGLIAAPYAAGLAVLAADEMEIGSTILDFGMGTTTAAIFAHGECVHVDGIALGGQHITMDLARGLSTRVEEAERLKTLQASVLIGATDESELVTVPTIDTDDVPNAVTRAQIVRMVKPRVEEIFEMIRDRLKAANMLAAASRRLVLTGGASQLTGLAEMAARLFNTTARIGRPLGMTNFSETAKGPAFAVAAGLLAYPQYAGREHYEPRRRHKGAEASYLARVGEWIRQSF